MGRPGSNETPSLVVIAGADLGRRIELERDQVLVGRADSSDIRFDDPRISRTHARLRRQGGAVYVEDIGSRAGTFVNHDRVTGPRQLHPGDVVALADVQLRFEGAAGAADVTQVGMPALAGPRDTTRSGPVQYNVDGQTARTINNVGRDQYLIEQRENFLREVASTRTKARYLIVLGFLLIIVGFALFAGGVLSFLNQIPEFGSEVEPTEFPTPFGKEIYGVPSGLFGWALAAAGSFLLIVGIVLHVVATSRRKRVDQNYPDPRWLRRGR